MAKLKKQAWNDDEHFDLSYRETRSGLNFCKDFEFSYDKTIRDEFKKDYPDKVAKIKQDILQKYPYLKYNPSYLQFRIDQEILPSIIIRNTTVVSLDCLPADLVEVLSGLEPSQVTDTKKEVDITSSKKEKPQKGDYPDMLADLLTSYLDALDQKERFVIESIYGLESYLDHPLSQKEVAAKLEMSQASLSVFKNKILQKLRRMALFDLEAAKQEKKNDRL